MTAEIADPPRKPLARLLALLSRWAHLVSILCLLVGLTSFFVLPTIDHSIGYDEKALLSGNADTGVYVEERRTARAAAFANESLLHHGKPEFFSYVKAGLEELGLEVSEQRFAAPTAYAQQNASAACSNLHGVLRSKRGDGKEAICLITPMHLSSFRATGGGRQDLHQSAGGAAVALGVAHLLTSFLSSVQWLAKDFIWIVPDASCGRIRSAESWVSAYDGRVAAGDGSHHNPAFARGGAIQQAIALEVLSGSVDAVQVLVEGDNGQLPKLDLYWLMHSAVSASMRGVTVHLDGHEQAMRWAQSAADIVGSKYSKRNLEKLATLTQFAGRQAVGLSTGAFARCIPGCCLLSGRSEPLSAVIVSNALFLLPKLSFVTLRRMIPVKALI